MEEIMLQFASNPWRLLLGAVSLLLLWGSAQVVEWTWLRPRYLDRALRKQGMRGTMYRFVSGDVKESNRQGQEACTKPMPLSHDISARLLPLLHGTMKKYGKQSFTWVGSTPSVTITDPELVMKILSDKCGQIEKPKLRLGRLLVKGLAHYKGDKWAKHRIILSPAFHIEKLKGLLTAFSTCCDELLERWDNCSGPNGSFELDVWSEMEYITGDVISRAAFGSNYQEGRQIFRLQKERAEQFKKSLTFKHIPFHWYLPNETNKRSNEIEMEIKTILLSIITKKEMAIQNGEVTEEDLLGLMLKSSMNEMEQNRKLKSSLSMTAEDVIEECKLFYFAGQETIQILLTWTIIVLCMHNEWQDKAREEVLQHFGRKNPDFEDLSRLKIVTMIIYEVLRLYPPLIMVQRLTCKALQIGNTYFPPGILLTIPFILIHHDTDIWGPDATEFKPTRFAGGISKAAKDGQVAFFPFGWGPRICIGQNFALLEAKMVLSRILQQFKFELSDKYMHAPCAPTRLLYPGNGAPVKFKRI